jgi:hypothetical protein
MDKRWMLEYVVTDVLLVGSVMGPTRKEARISAVVPVRISAINEDGEPVHCLAHTLNVSRRGALLAGITLPLRLGGVVRIIRGRSSASFKVAWIGSKEANSEHQVGVESLEAVSNFWGLEHSKPISVDDEHLHAERRTRTPSEGNKR